MDIIINFERINILAPQLLSVSPHFNYNQHFQFSLVSALVFPTFFIVFLF